MTRKLLPVGVVVLAAVAVIVWMFGRGDTRPGARPVTTAASSGSAAPATRPAERPGTAQMEAAPQVWIDDDPRGKETLEGQVVDADKQPVGGAIVVLSSNPPRTMTTEADGGFAFDGLVERPYTVVARKGALVAGPTSTVLTGKSEPVILELRAGGTVKVSVTSSTGAPVDRADVELRGFEDRSEPTKSGVAVFEGVAPGGYQIAASAPGMAKTFQWIGVGAGETEAKLTLVAGAPVVGRVVDPSGSPIAGARVRFSGASDWSQQGSDRHDAALTDKQGGFEIAAMPAGTFRFVASHPAYAPGSSPMITLDGTTRRDAITITLAPGAKVRGRVVDAAKQGVASARVRIGVQAANSRAMVFEAPRQAYTDDTGAFEIVGLPRRGLSAVAMHETGASSTKDLDTSSGDVTNFELVLDVTGTIAGVVVDPDGQPLEGIQVTAGPSFRDNRASVDFSQWRLRGFPQGLTDPSGAFRLTGLAPGAYSISASKSARPRMMFGAGPDGVTASTGDTNVKLVLPPSGAVKGKVQLVDGSSPSMFTVGVAMTSRPGNPDGSFLLDDLAPQTYELTVRGPSFQTRVIEIRVESGKTADAGTISVEKGRRIAGRVVQDGKPVAGATVYAGRLLFGNGTSSSAQFGPMGQGTKKDTTDADGAFALDGFPSGDITIVAEHETLGRSRAMRLPTVLPGQTELTLALEAFGSLTGVLRQGGKPAEGVFVSCQSTTTPGAIYSVASGPDGRYRFDRLAPDTYRVSATLGMPMSGMRFYSKQMAVPAGKEVSIDLAVEPGAVTLDVTLAASNGSVGVAQAYLTSAVVAATTANELGLAMAAAGPGASQFVIVRQGEPARFGEIVPGRYTMCAVPYPAEVRGMASMGYAERHGDTLLAFCKPITVAASPTTQTTTLPVTLPPFQQDGPPGPGPGGGSGSAQ